MHEIPLQQQQNALMHAMGALRRAAGTANSAPIYLRFYKTLIELNFFYASVLVLFSVDFLSLGIVIVNGKKRHGWGIWGLLVVSKIPQIKLLLCVRRINECAHSEWIGAVFLSEEERLVCDLGMLDDERKNSRASTIVWKERSQSLCLKPSEWMKRSLRRKD